MSNSFSCPKCSAQYPFNNDLVGKTVRCRCGNTFQVSLDAGAQQPIAPMQQPMAPAQQPIAPIQQPMVPVQQPIAPMQQPMAPVQQPMAPMQQPMAPTYQWSPKSPNVNNNVSTNKNASTAKLVRTIGLVSASLVLIVVATFIIISKLSGDSHESVVADMNAVVLEMMDLLVEVESAEDARKIKGTLIALGNEMKAINERAQALEKPSRDKQDELRELLAPTIERMPEFIRKINALEANPEIRTELAVLEDVIGGQIVNVEWFD